MKYLDKYTDFNVVLEHSKNDPIPEINNSNKLGIILIGAPGIGKSTFAKNFIYNKNRNIKIFSTDDVSLTLTKKHDVYRKGSSQLNLKRLSMFIKSGGSFIYDTTGVQRENISNVTEEARVNGYDVIYIHLMGPLDLSLRQNTQRERNVPDYHIKNMYDEQYKNMHYFSSLNPDNYYIVYNIDGKYKFMKFDGTQILKRKVDKYVPLNESIDNDKVIENIKSIFSEKIDDGFIVDAEIKNNELIIDIYLDYPSNYNVLKYNQAYFNTLEFEDDFIMLDDYLDTININREKRFIHRGTVSSETFSEFSKNTSVGYIRYISTI